MRSLTSWERLLELRGKDSESGDLDFKFRLDLPPKEAKKARDKAKIECAKDVAALANCLGGHVLFGVKTEGTRCTDFPGIEKHLATQIIEFIEPEVKERCWPRPIFDVRPIPVPGTQSEIVVVAVEMSHIAPVGVRLCQENGGHLVPEGYAFPIRVGSHTNYLVPEQFGVYESMSARRAAALLNSIPTDQRQQVCLSWPTGCEVSTHPGWQTGEGPSITRRKVHFICVNLDGNVATFREPDQERLIDLPLDQIRTVWRRTNADSLIWEVSLLGQVLETGEYRPKN